MIFAQEARDLSDAARFGKSEHAGSINSTIRKAAARGDNQASMLVPMNIADHAAAFLVAHGFHVAAQMHENSMLITANW